MTQFDNFHTLVENSGNSVILFLSSKQPKSEIYQKMPMFEELKNQVLVNPKMFLTPHQKDLGVNFLTASSAAVLYVAFFLLLLLVTSPVPFRPVLTCPISHWTAGIFVCFRFIPNNSVQC
jgi:hypothetical protein